MNEIVPVELSQGIAQSQTKLQAFFDRQFARGCELARERSRCVIIGIDILTKRLVITQLHDVKQISVRLVQTGMQHINKTIVRSGNRLELANPRQLPFERPLVLEKVLMNYLYCPIASYRAAGQPNFTITAAPDPADELVVGDEDIRDNFDPMLAVRIITRILWPAG